MAAIAKATGSWYRTLGRDGARFGIVAWGSQYGMLREWVAARPDYRVFLPEALHPFPLEAFAEWRKGLEFAAVVEMNYQGQLHRYLAGLTDMRDVSSVARSGGQPLSGRELEQLLEEARR
jgi:pyruvate/2-oxoacid:ferredoxin oxidoreductase alpha subunit